MINSIHGRMAAYFPFNNIINNSIKIVFTDELTDQQRGSIIKWAQTKETKKKPGSLLVPLSHTNHYAVSTANTLIIIEAVPL
jgi:hypothetical protein